jgi:predicted MFS family arabinose efflux permease
MYRMVYPFMVVFARGLGVDVSVVATAVAARSALGLAAPLLGSSADRSGRKRGMLTGLVVFVAGTLLVVFRPTLPAFVAALLLSGAGKMMFDPAMQAYLGDIVGYRQRGLAIAVTEMGWSTAFLLGVPAVGWIIARRGWPAAFPWIAAAGVIVALALWRILPADGDRPSATTSLGEGFRRIVSHRAALAGLAMSLILSAANESVNIVFGVWLESAFALQVAALGAAAAVIGLAEVSGESLVALIADRVGKRRAVAGGILMNCIACLLLPRISTSSAGALVALFFFYLSFEFTVVSSIPLMTELVPAARATLMSGNIAAFSAGRAAGAAVGIAVFTSTIAPNASVAIALDLIGLAVLAAWVRD